MKSKTFSTLWTIDDEDCTVDFRYHPGHPGTWYRRNGDPGDPPEPDEVEIVKIVRGFEDVTGEFADELSENDNFLERATEIYAESQLPEDA